MSELGNPRPSGSSERPWYVEFFFDKKKPAALRGGVAALVGLLVLYPLISIQFGSHSKTKDEPAESPASGQNASKSKSKPGEKEDASSRAASEQGDVPATETGEKTDANRRPVISSVSVVSTKSAIDPIFHPIAGVNPLLIRSLVTAEGDFWVASMQQIYQLKSVEKGERQAVLKLDPSSYDQIFSDDLPSLTSMVNAPDGSIWVGAKDGTLFRYADYDWKVIAAAGEPFQTPIRAITAFENRLYIGGVQGLWKWDAATQKITRFPAFEKIGIRTFTVRARPDGQKELLMGADNGVWRLTDKGWAQFIGIGGSDKYAQAIFDLGPEGVLVGTADGILRVSPVGIVLDRFIPGNDVNTIAADPKGQLWVGTRTSGMKYWDGAKWFQSSVDLGFPGNNVTSLDFDAQGNLWIGVFGRGLFTAPLEELRVWISKHSDSSKAVDTSAPKFYNSACKAAAAEVREGTSGSVSLFQFDGKEYVFFSGHQVCPLGAGFLTLDRTAYLLSGWNLTIASAGTRQEVEIPKEYPADQVKKEIFVDSNRRVWFGPVSSGPFLYTPAGPAGEAAHFQTFTDIPQLAQNPTAFILEDKRGGIFWIGSAPAFDHEAEEFHAPSLHRYDGTNWRHYSRSNDTGLNSWRLHDGILRKDGSIAIAGDNGLALIKGDSVERVKASDNLRKRLLFSVFEDRLGDLWFGQQLWGPGVTYYDATAFHNVTSDQGLFSDRIIAVSQDSLDRMWLLASNGTVAIYPRSFFDRKVAEEGGTPGADTPQVENPE